ncbi:MAG: Chaperone protein DnaK [candidate division WS6 bacterium OLB20]|uniref:Chaperone protein DnaK n=1 Tax=candidate division WS6 bacterium OLB20 TaxID=1617426 RepID=A0A136M0Q2_9BACT|nr:MAG: Chaperone protein DnaK [candidate division WS6 bacterium OLB20]
MGKIIGIDLGTTNSCMAFAAGGDPDVITNKEGNRTTPSIVALTSDNKEELVGISAKNQMVTNPAQTFYSIKRLIGRRWDEVGSEGDNKRLPFEVRKSKKGGVEVKFGDSWLAPEAVSAKVLAKLKSDAEAFLGETVTEAVITVPAYFDDSQRQATKNAGKIAGLEVKRIINEPTAAALAYGLDKKEDKLIAVYDLGGGTFDISILEIGDGVFEVKSTNGDTHLGGDDFDEAIIDWLVDDFKKEQNIDLREDPAALQRLKEAAEKAKITLSTTEKTEINLPYITADANGPKHMRKDFTRADLERLVGDLVAKTFEPVKKALKDAGVDKSEIEDVVMVGGMTRMPMVTRQVKEFFGKDPHQGVNPDEVVAIGAAIQGAVLAGDSSVSDITLLDVTPLTLGLETLGGIRTPLIERNTTIPTEKTQVFSTAADNQTAVEIHVLQGEREMAKDNKTLGRFMLEGIPPAPRGIPQVEVSFKIDANGILNVSARDKASGKEQSITITASTQLDDSEVDALVKEAAEKASEDKQNKERIEAKIEAESLVLQLEKFVDEMKDKLDDADKEALKKAADELKELYSKDDYDAAAVKEKTKEVSTLLQEKGAAMYAKAAEEVEKEETGSSEEADVQEGEVIEPDDSSKK